MPNSKNEIIETVDYLGQPKDIRTHNLTAICTNFMELGKLITTCNETGLNISEVIRLMSQSCCKCGNESIQYLDKSSGEMKTFKRPTFLAPRRRNYFKKKRK